MSTQNTQTAALISLVKPTVSAALDGGLIPIVHLSAPLAVTFPVWPAAETNYTYQLVFDGVRVPPEKVILETDKPGDSLDVEVPVSLLAEGLHAVSYRAYSPFGDSEVFSESTSIQIDRTAPGAPDLSPIILPAEIQDGLTSDELESLNNVLPGRIAGYSGMAAGDEIRTYWGSLAGPLVFVDANDMGLNHLTVEFTRGFLEQADGVSSEVYYTVTDLAGNLSMPSEKLSVNLQLTVIKPLPSPTIKEAQDDLLDPANAVNGATVVIGAGANLREGEKVAVRWSGPKGSDLKEQVVTAAQAGQAISLVFSSALVTVNDGQTVEVFYSVTRGSGVVQESDKVAVKILSAALDLPAPTLDTVGPDGVLRPSLITGPSAVARASYRGMDPSDQARVRWVGKTTYDGAPVAVGNSTHLSFSIPKQFIDEAEGGDATVRYIITRNGVERESQALALTVREGMVLDTSPAALPGKIYLIPGRPEVLPAFPGGTTIKRAATGGRPPYTYSTSDPAVAQVDDEGLTSVRGNGVANITVTDAAGESKSYSVSVTGVIACVGVGSGNLTQISGASSNAGGRVPSVHELNEIYNAYGGSWPLGNANYWSSTVAKNVFGAKWYYVKNLNTGKDFMLLHTNKSLGVAIR